MSKYLKMEPVTMTQIHQINDWTNIQLTAYVTSNACISFIKIRPHNDGSSLNYILLGVEGGVFFFLLLFSNFIIIRYGILTLCPNWQQITPFKLLNKCLAREKYIPGTVLM